MSAAGLISLVNKAANLGSFIFWCIICSWIITFQDFYTCFRRVFRLFSYLLLGSWNRFLNHRSRNVSTPERPVCRAMDDDVITGDDVGIAMEKLGLLRAGQRAEEMETLMLSSEYCSFESVEASLGEVREAFEVFDENNDGFIDGGELRSVMSCIGLTERRVQEDDHGF
ncbi:putative calcium-binding protein CML46 [Sesamum alatum]|uniref:Calcium-binding protein CML46 n=1 Tax=Sesamum alatum TaxID=300844 RepID=A0AAE1YCV0_9LAMI|nr:putative calcium-binding protein CML46 [Sesamum alatum]